MNNCLFCKIIHKEVPALIVYENDNVIVFLSLENHPLIVPKKHFKNIYGLEDVYAEDIMKTAVTISKVVQEVTGCDGVNLVQSNGAIAGQDVFHFHLHIKPRWKNDGVTLTWNTDSVNEDTKTKQCEDLRVLLENSRTD